MNVVFKFEFKYDVFIFEIKGWFHFYLMYSNVIRT